MARVGFGLHRLLVRRGVKTWPPGTGVVFGIRTKQSLPAADTLINSGRFRVLILSREGRFRTLLAGHIVLIRRELLLPNCLVLADFLVHLSSLPLLAFGLRLAPSGYQIRPVALTIRLESPGVSLY